MPVPTIDWEAAYDAFTNSSYPSVSSFVMRSGFFKTAISLCTVYCHFSKIRRARETAPAPQSGAIRCVTAQDLSPSQLRALTPSSSQPKPVKSQSPEPSSSGQQSRECFIDLPGGATIRFTTTCPELSAAAVLHYLQEAH